MKKKSTEHPIASTHFKESVLNNLPILRETAIDGQSISILKWERYFVLIPKLCPQSSQRWIATLIFIGITLISIKSPITAHGASHVNDGSPMGINLSSIRYWSTELPFKDLFKHSQPWVSQEEGKPYGEGPALALTPEGWIRWLRPGQYVDTLMCRGTGHYPAGGYKLRYQGRGEIQLQFDAILSTSPRLSDPLLPLMDLAAAMATAEQSNFRNNDHVRPPDTTKNERTRTDDRELFQIQKETSASQQITEIPFTVPYPSAKGIGLMVTTVDDIDPLHHIEILPDAYQDDDITQLFQPQFLERWSRFKVIRFMDWMETNNSPIQRWEDRPTTAMQTQGSSKGVALSYMIALANTLHADPWFSMPHMADDDYVRQFAETVADTLNPDLKIYIEYTNEAWNHQFDQTAYCIEKGRAMGLSTDPVQAGLFYYTRRALEIFEIWQNVFQSAKEERLIRVLSSQFANPWTAHQLFADPETAHHVDALAVAPYFGTSLSPSAATVEISPGHVVAKSALSVDQILDICEADIEENASTLDEYAALTAKLGVDLIAYEGGQHLVAEGTAASDETGEMGETDQEADEETVNFLFQKANRHPRMGRLYRKDLRQWRRSGGGLFVTFASMGTYSKWGYWGLLEYEGQPIHSAPKYQAIQDYIDRYNGKGQRHQR